MMKNCTNRSLFSALLARISKRWRYLPESRERIVKVVENGSLRNTTLTGKDVKMDTDTNVVETPVVDAVVDAVVEIDGPQKIMARKAKQGQGKCLLTVASKADAAEIIPELTKTLEQGYTIFTRAHQPVEIVTAVDWKKAREVLDAREVTRKDAIASLTPEQLAALPELAKLLKA